VKPPASEGDLVSMLLEAAPFALPRLRIFRRPIINTRSTEGFRVRTGIPGQADCYAVVAGGRHIELEAKAARGHLETAQKAWREWCRAFEVPHLVLRAKAGEPPGDTVQRWIEEIRAVAQ
jgi:hypothetical protein